MVKLLGKNYYKIKVKENKMEKQNLPTECYHPTDNATNAFPQIQSTPTGNE